MAAVKLSKQTALSILDSIDVVLVDCDGVLWAGNEAIEGSRETLDFFRWSGKQVFFVTNNSTKTRSQYLKKLNSMGFQATIDEIATSGYLVASYLKSINFQKKVYLIGSPGLAEELDTHGIEHTPIGVDNLPTDVHSWIQDGISLENDIGAVVVGFDQYISYPKMLKAANYLSNPDCLFLVTNCDETLPVEVPLVVPGTGTMVAAIKTCSGREPSVFGKPSRPMFQAIQNQCKFEPSRALMVGDRCNTDINFGKNCGMKTLLVLSGVTNLPKLEDYQTNKNEDLIPDVYTEKLGDFLQLIKE